MNLPGHRRRAVGGSLIFGVGESGGILATFAFLAKDAPQYRFGYSLSLAFLAAECGLATAYWAACKWQNRGLRRAEEDGIVDGRVVSTGMDFGYRYFL